MAGHRAGVGGFYGRLQAPRRATTANAEADRYLMRYLLDTNICIYAIRSRSPEVIEKLRTLRPGDVGISAVTAYELWSGVHKSQHARKNAAALERFLSAVSVLPFD